MMKLKKCIFLIIILITCFIHVDIYAGNNPDYKEKLNAVLDEPRIFFEPEKVERILLKNFHDTRGFDLRAASETYDILSKRNDGYMSVDDLFYICVKAMGQSGLDKNGKFNQNWQKTAWVRCKNSFILPLLDLVDEEMFIDESVVEVYDGTRFYQKCTDPAYAKPEEDVLNMVCTTGKYKDIDPAFEKAMITKFRLEGGCKDVHDKNGMTCFGVASKWNKEVSEKYPNFTRADAEKIAHDRYYTQYKIDALPDAIRGDVFMALWGTGNSEKSIGLLQDILGVKRNKIVDIDTVQAAERYRGNLRKRFLKARWELQKDNDDFSNGWAKAFMVYIKNGCHTKTETPLLRTRETMDECKKYL